MKEYSAQAALLVASIKELAANPDRLDSLESYLSQHFPVWLSKYAGTPENLTAELIYWAGLDGNDLGGEGV